MIHRLIYTAQYKYDQKEKVKNFLLQKAESLPVDLYTISIFCWQKNLYLYYESVNIELHPDDFLFGIEAFLEEWPGEDKKRHWVQVYDIFHYNQPISTEQWQRQQKTQPYAQIARLKPETLSRYIYYHYQYQEEMPGNGDKYGVIGLHENLEFFYLEQPTIIEEPAYAGSLSTHLRPQNWQEVMNPHFIPWDDMSQGQYWKPIELMFHF